MPTTPPSAPALDSLVHVRWAGVRSIHIERDLSAESISQGYVLTPQGLALLERMALHFHSATPSRAWTLTGPYGSGKSYFGLFLMNLLCRRLAPYEHSRGQLAAVAPALAEQVDAIAGQGWLPVPITGYRTSLHHCLRSGLQQALGPYLHHPPLAQLAADPVLTDTTAPSRSLIAWLEQLQIVLGAPELGFSGALIVLDEMGKALEYTAAQADTADIYLLQELAEFANRSHAQPLVFVGILHQGFEHYAGFLDNTTQREWSKVQGRFEDAPFQEPPHQQMWLVARAIESAAPDVVATTMQGHIRRAVEGGWRPPLMESADFAQVSAQAYPFHPTSLAALPYLFRRLAQNERSLFAYLASQEPFGFQEFLHRETPPATIRLADLFDYVTANFQGRLYSSTRARLITETMERLEHAPADDPLAYAVLKTIGLLNWLAEVSPLQATRPSLLAALCDDTRDVAQIERTLDELQRRSLIVFRRFNDSFAVWQGSDVDLGERLAEAHRHLHEAYSLADAVQRYLPPRPAVAHRHSYETGALRYFDIRYADPARLANVDLTPTAGADGLVLLCLPLTAGE